MARSYACDRTVARVPMTPMRWRFDTRSAVSAPGSTAPMTGTSLAAARAGSALADAVLHATRSSLMSRSTRKRWQASE